MSRSWTDRVGLDSPGHGHAALIPHVEIMGCPSQQMPNRRPGSSEIMLQDSMLGLIQHTLTIPSTINPVSDLYQELTGSSGTRRSNGIFLQ